MDRSWLTLQRGPVRLAPVSVPLEAGPTVRAARERLLPHLHYNEKRPVCVGWELVRGTLLAQVVEGDYAWTTASRQVWTAAGEPAERDLHAEVPPGYAPALGLVIIPCLPSGEILYLKRSADVDSDAGLWSVIGEGPRWGESVEASVTRALREELAATPTGIQVLGLGINLQHLHYNVVVRADLPAHGWENWLQAQDAWEHDAVKPGWPSSPPRPLVRATRDLLEQFWL